MSTPTLEKNNEPKKHSKIGASSMSRWARCPGSVRLCENLPLAPPSQYAEAGTKAHVWAEKLLKARLWPKKFKIPEPAFGETSEDAEAVEVYVDFVASEFEKAASCGPAMIKIEHRFDLSELKSGLYGTSDAVIYHSDKKRLQVIDYKHGAGIPVDPARNEQLQYYGLGALLSLKLPCEVVELVIVQPRCFHSDGPVRKWELSAVELQEFAADLVEFACRTEEPNAPLVAGDHCRFCPATGTCPEMLSVARSVAINEFSQAIPYSQTKLGEVLAWLPRLEGWAKSVREFAYQEAIAGRIPEGFKLVEKRASREWNNDEKNIELKLQALGFSKKDIYKTELKSPAQIEKMLKGAQGKKLIEPLVRWVSSGQTLVPETDKRKSVLTSPENDFTKLENQESEKKSHE